METLSFSLFIRPLNMAAFKEFEPVKLVMVIDF